MQIQLRSALSHQQKAVSLLEISFLRCPSDIVVAQEQLKIIALKVEMQDIDISKEREVHCNRADSI